ncbi:MAG TPA: AAA family ATPase [candidate division Zixibacteria bacterium]|nr:AAA family ATPase [candidate division Zixibacteria bacterium]
MADQKLVLGVAGMPGSGKSLVLRAAKENGYDVVVMGDVVRQEAGKKNLQPNPENIGRIMLELREKEGKDVIAKRCIPLIGGAKKHKVLVDGIRSLDEVEEFKKRFPKFSLMAICSSPETRFQRLYRRRRSDDAVGWDVFHERDMRELSVGLGNVIAMAEYTVVNEEALEVVKNRVKHVLRKMEEKWKK